MRRAFVCLALLTGALDAARILGIYPMTAKSHFSFSYSIMKTLHAAGHHVTMISPHPPSATLDNFTHIDSSHDKTFAGRFTLEEFHGLSVHGLMTFVSASDTQYCHEVLNLKEIQEALRSTERLYDIMLIEIRTSFECYLPLAEKLGIPVIGTTSMLNWRPADLVAGIPHNLATIPLGLSTSTPDMNIFQRAHNAWSSFVLYYHRERTRAAIADFYREYYSEELLYKKDVSLVFYNNHASLLPRSMPPNVVEIGGVHTPPAKPLPKNVQKFIDEAPHGVILFTLGSIAKAASLQLEQRNAFLTAFASIPQRIIWKYEESIENLPLNIMISEWLPQRDILEHKNVILFVSHCGQSGLYEAVITGTPMITVPLFGDQMSNAALLRRLNVSLYVDLDSMTKESFLNALNTIVNDTSYRQRMQELSRTFKDRPQTPQETLVYWTEYVIRYNGASYLKALGTDLPPYKYLMLDIIALAIAIACVALFLLFGTMRRIRIAIKRKAKKE